MNNWRSSRKLTLTAMSLLLLVMAAVTLFLLLTEDSGITLHYALLIISFFLFVLVIRIFFAERKKSTEELLKSEKRYQILAEVSPVGIFHTDAKGYTTYVNPRWTQISGFSAEKALGYGWLDAVHMDDKQELISGWEEATDNRNRSLSEYRFVRPDGTVVWVLGQAFPQRNSNNEIIGYVGTTTDITERKKIASEIEKIYKDKETVLNSISDAMVSVDNEWRYTFLNDAALPTHPLGREETLGKTLWDVHPELTETLFGEMYKEAMKTRKVMEVESYFPFFNTWFAAKVYPSNNGLTIFYRDVSERKKNEEKNMRNELRLRKAQEIGKLGYWQQEIGSEMVWASKEAMNIYGFPPIEGELHRDQITDCIIDLEIIEEGLTALIKENKEFNVEVRINPADGGPMKYIAAVAEVERNENGEGLRTLGTFLDITDRIQAKNEILIEKNLSDSIINSLPGIFYLYNQEGKFLRWNKNFEVVSKYSGAEISIMHPLDFFDTSDKLLLAQKISNTFVAGEDYVQADFFLKTKEKIPYYFTGTAIEYNNTPCLMGVGIDFSERVKAQEKIKETTEQLRRLTAHLQHIREEERKRIGREIHDELGQQLTAIKMDIAWIDKKTPEETLIKNKLKNVIGLLDASNQSIRRILSELRPAILDNRGLEDAINWVSKQFTSSTGIQINLNCTIDDIELPDATATCIFRVFQEALTNITKYSGASMVEACLYRNENEISISITDNGKGFDPTAVKSQSSFGILGMQERVFSLGGIFKLDTSPGKGTAITISLPYTYNNTSPNTLKQ